MTQNWLFFRVSNLANPVDTGHKLNVLCAFNLRPVSMGEY